MGGTGAFRAGAWPPRWDVEGPWVSAGQARAKDGPPLPAPSLWAQLLCRSQFWGAAGDDDSNSGGALLTPAHGESPYPSPLCGLGPQVRRSPRY